LEPLIGRFTLIFFAKSSNLVMSLFNNSSPYFLNDQPNV